MQQKLPDKKLNLVAAETQIFMLQQIHHIQ